MHFFMFLNKLLCVFIQCALTLEKLKNKTKLAELLYLLSVLRKVY